MAVASGMILIAFSVGTVANPCTCKIDRNTLYTSASFKGFEDTTVTLPLTRGSMMKFLPVICDTLLITATRSASLKLRVTSSA